MTVLRISLLLVVLGGFLSACDQISPSHREKPTIFVSILPLAFFAESIVGDAIDVKVLVGPGKSPETFEPLPRDLASLGRAEIFFASGVPFERVWLPKIRSNHTDLTIVDLSERSVLVTSSRGDSHTENDHSHDHDMHSWTSPLEARRMAREMRDHLIQQFPDLLPELTQNHTELDDELIMLEKLVSKRFTPFSGTGEFVVMHPAWGALAESYRLKQIAIEQQGKAPNAQTLEKLITYLRGSGVKYVFTQPQHSGHMANTVASAIDAEVVAIDPLNKDYLNNMRYVAEQLVLSMQIQGRSEQPGHSSRVIETENTQHHH